MSKFDRNRIKDGWEKLYTNKQTDRQTDKHYENNGHLAVNQYMYNENYATIVTANKDFIAKTILGQMTAKASIVRA